MHVALPPGTRLMRTDNRSAFITGAGLRPPAMMCITFERAGVAVALVQAKLHGIDAAQRN